jgi:ABC-type glycerol-3-phosphate transport system substrate-binding protein
MPPLVVRLLPVVLVVGLVLAGCGGDDEPAAAPDTTTTIADPDGTTTAEKSMPPTMYSINYL